MDVRSWQELMDQVAERTTGLLDGDAWLALVDDPLGAQRLVHLELLPTDAYLEERRFGREAIRVTIERLALPELPGQPYAARLLPVLVTTRYGASVLGHHEMEWFYAWRYANIHHAQIATSVLVTQAGWWAVEDDVGASLPAMTP